MVIKKLKISLLIIMIITILSVFSACDNQISSSSISAKEGIIDLSNIYFEDNFINLDGEWEFYWEQLIEPDQINKDNMTGYIKVPGSWNKYLKNQGLGDKSKSNGYGSYRLTLIMEEDSKLALRIPRMHTAYKLWLNGELAASAGTVGESRATSKAQYLPKRIFLDANKGKNEIIIQVSNFHHRNGGILENIKLGDVDQILRIRYKSLAKSILIFGCLIIMAIYHISLYLNRRKDNFNLYFGLVCLSFGIRSLMYGENFFIYLFPNFSWEITHKIVTLSFYLGVPILVEFFYSLFPKYFSKTINKLIKIVSIIFGLLVILTPARIFTVFNPLYQIWTVLIIIYTTINMVRILIKKEKDGWILFIGAISFFIGSINEILFHSILKNDRIIDLNSPFMRSFLFKQDNSSSAGLLIFAIANSLLLARKFTNSLSHEEMLVDKLARVNKNLDSMVLKRTEELLESKDKIEEQKLELEEKNQQLETLSLKDSLTNLWNRRKYNEVIALRWLENQRYQRPITLMLIDIDYFKRYNDKYGHMAGDDCLKKVAHFTANHFSRSTDTVIRYGGEEFLVLLSEIEEKNALLMAENLRKGIENLKIPHVDSLISDYITVSIGISSAIPGKGFGHEDLFRIVDKALYQAKNTGRNKVIFLSD